MASVRTARILAVLAAVPLLVGASAGVAQADNFVPVVSPFGNVASLGSGVGDDNEGNSTTTLQSANGFGATNESNTASVNRSAFTPIDQSETTNLVVFDG